MTLYVLRLLTSSVSALVAGHVTLAIKLLVLILADTTHALTVVGVFVSRTFSWAVAVTSANVFLTFRQAILVTHLCGLVIGTTTTIAAVRVTAVWISAVRI